MKTILALILVCSSTIGFAVITPLAIPRSPSPDFFHGGLFAGGDDIRANIENLRYFFHPREGFERWVLDFSDAATRTLDSKAPRFQLRYVKSRRELIPTGSREVSPARLILSLRHINRNFLTEDRIQLLTEKSRLVKNVVVYPAIENGDRVMEFVLTKDVSFDPEQPLEKVGRLVIDLKPAPLESQF